MSDQRGLQEAEDFAAYLDRYGGAAFAGYGVYDHIRHMYIYSRGHCEDERTNGRLFNAFVDLELNYMFIMKGVDIAAGIHNRLHSSGKVGSGSVLQDFDLFSGKVDVLFSLSSLSFRIRAFWDKYMGILFLLYDWQKYEDFYRSRSRRKYFSGNAKEWSEMSLYIRKCMTNVVKTLIIHSGRREEAKELENVVVSFPSPFLEIMGDLIDQSDEIRTPEAHGSGILRKWSLANLPIDRSRDFALVNHWNVVNEFMHALRATIAERSVPDSSPPQ